METKAAIISGDTMAKENGNAHVQLTVDQLDAGALFVLKSRG